jgi:hypothetical protein
MIEIRYSVDEAIEISGTQIELGKLRNDLLKFIQTDLEKINIEVDININPQPWGYVGKDLLIFQSGNGIKVSINENNVIKIEGSKSNLENFASFLWFEKDAKSGHHSHFEYFEGNDEYVNSESFPLIIQIK